MFCFVQSIRGVMQRVKREITKEQFINVMENHTTEGIFTPQEAMGYGIYQERFYEQDGKYYVDFMLGSSCD